MTSKAHPLIASLDGNTVASKQMNAPVRQEQNTPPHLRGLTGAKPPPTVFLSGTAATRPKPGKH